MVSGGGWVVMMVVGDDVGGWVGWVGGLVVVVAVHFWL
jgi:hypothetical protein